MCGRFYLDVRADEMKALLSLSEVPDLEPRYNIAPSQPVLAVMVDENGRTARRFRWGLIPSWAKDAKSGYRMVNARSETVDEKPAFRTAFRRRRCLIPASGYFEWREEAGGKQPYCIHPTKRPLLVFAGLYEHWRDSQGQAIDSCTILVTDAIPSVAAIHDRMPLCLEPDRFAAWLDPKLQDPIRLQALIQNSVAPEVECYPVTRRMNNPRHDEPDAITPLKESFFEETP